MAPIRSLGYTAYTGANALQKLNLFPGKKNYAGIFVIGDTNTLQYCLPVLKKQCPALSGTHTIELKPGETSKSLKACAHIWNTLTSQNAGRDCLIINLGGGVVSDVGGFCAAVYKRGVDFVNVPTSLLAMADASVGGKNGIDFDGIKNNLGTFTQPRAVFIYPPFLNTLPLRHMNNGMAEILKIALVADKTFWKKIPEAKSPEQLISHSVALKNAIVLKDPFDTSARAVLNFGHTVGHAIEAFSLNSHNPWLHGEAVIAGMIAESHIAWQKKLLQKKQLDEISATLKSYLTRNDKVPDVSQLRPYLAQDKKSKAQTLMFSLPDGIGSCKIRQTAGFNLLAAAIRYYNGINHA